MKSLIILSALFVILNGQNYAQIGCASATPSLDFLSTISPSAKAPQINDAVIQLYFHIVRRTNGTGNLSVSDVIQGYQALQYQFNAQNICFVFLGFDFINDNNFFKDYKEIQDASLTSKNPHSNAIDIYIITKEGNSQGVDYPYYGKTIGGIPGKTIIVHREGLTYGGTTLAHELGHCLGLYHTFETAFCLENPNGSNSTTCGDLIDDTPADIDWYAQNIDANTKVNSSCNYIGGNGYSPSTNNVMSYYENCRTLFTPKQGDKMRLTIANSSILQQCLIASNITIFNKSFPYTNSTNFACQNINFQSLSCPPIIYNEIYRAKNKISTFFPVIVNPYPFNNPFSYTTSIGFISENEIELLDGFEVKEGARFAAQISLICPASIAYKNAAQSNQSELNDLFGINDVSNEQFVNEISLLNANQNLLLKDNTLIYPNPTNGAFTLLLNDTKETPLYISIKDYLGKEVKRINNPSSYELNIDISELNNGFYFVNIQYEWASISKKISKQ